MFVGGTAIFLFVMVLLALAFLRPGVGRDIAPRRWLVWGGLAFPGVTLSALLVFALANGERLLPHPEAGVYAIEAIPSQWAWTFRYPDGRQTIDKLHLPVGRPIDMHVTGTDVIHSFWVPRLGGKVDAIPGHVNVLRIQADRAGTFGGVCSEFCGTGHTDMRFTAIAHDGEQFEQALASAAGPAASAARETTP